MTDHARERAARAVAARDLAWTAAALLAIDPRGVGGIHLSARPGPELDDWTAALRGALGDRPLRRMPPHIDAGRLTGELDLVGSLREGRRIVRAGLLTEADGGVVLVPMAERLERETGAVLAEALDTGRVLPRLPGLAYAPADVAAVLVDESRDDEPGLPDIVQERMGCLVVLEPVGATAAPPPGIDAARVSRARGLVADVIPDESDMETFVLAAARLGIESIRAPIRALRVARAHRAWRAAEGEGPDSAPLRLGDDDLAVAAALALLPRATVAPAPPDAADDSTPPPPPPPSESDDDGGDDLDGPSGPLAERIVEAAEAHLPEGLVSRFAEARARGTGRRGAKLRQLIHGHRVGARRGDPRRGGRVDLPATLRAAAPWQRARRAAAATAATAAAATTTARGATSEGAAPSAPTPIVHVRPSDLHVQERVRRSATATVFVVDASGSQALNRLAEVKGAVELFLAESYVRRDQVALVVFRDRGATVAVPPTRSLVRVRRLLRGMAGGGGTPLAAGLEQAWKIALRLEASEASPRIVLLSDGRPNVGLDGAGGRARAREDAIDVARRIAASGIPSLVLDSSARGERFATELGEALRGTVAHLPRPDARGLRRALDLFGADAP